MHQVTVSIQLQEEIYKILSRYAALAHRDVEALAGELLSEQLADMSPNLEAERIMALPLAERRALARGAWGSWKLPTGTKSIDLVRQLRNEWTR